MMSEAPPPLTPSSKSDLWDLGLRGLKLRRLGQKDMIEVFRVAPMCVADWMNEHFETPALVEALCWCSPHRDLLDDLERGLINVPSEVLRSVGEGRHEAFGEWLRADLASGRTALESSRRQLREIPRHDPGKRAVELFTSAIERYARRYERVNHDLLSGSAPVPRAVVDLASTRVQDGKPMTAR